MTKQEYILYAADLLQDISNRIDELKQRTSGINPKVKLEFDQKIENLVAMRNELHQHLESFDEIPESRWQETKNEFMKGIDFLKNGFQNLYSMLSQ